MEGDNRIVIFGKDTGSIFDMLIRYERIEFNGVDFITFLEATFAQRKRAAKKIQQWYRLWHGIKELLRSGKEFSLARKDWQERL